MLSVGFYLVPIEEAETLEVTQNEADYDIGKTSKEETHTYDRSSIA